MKILLIDNYDSFTFNLYQLIAEVTGEIPVVFENDRLSWDDLCGLSPDNIIISPGPGRPDNERDFGICESAILHMEVPLLGVCLGHQGICHLFGGQVVHAPEPYHGRISRIFHKKVGLFAGINQGFSAVRYHSLVAAYPLTPELEEIAWTSDGLIMGVKHQSKPIWGVQFHPESICTEYGAQLIKNFCKLSVDYHQERGRKVDLKGLGYLNTQYSWALDNSMESVDAVEWQVLWRKLSFYPGPEDTFNGLFSNEEVAFWLDSSLIRPGLSRFSFMGDGKGPNGALIRYFGTDRRLVVKRNGQESEEKIGIFDYLKRELKHFHCSSPELPFDFTCGFVGYFGYELKEECGGNRVNLSSYPDSIFLFADRIIVFDHLDQSVYLVCLSRVGEENAADNWFCEIEARIRAANEPALRPSGQIKTPLLFNLEQPRDQYLNNIQKSLDLIRDGISYEICLTNRLRVNSHVNPLDFYLLLRQINPAPYSAFLRFPDVSIACSSPERFLKIDSTGLAESKPIKGTARRGAIPEEDEKLRELLRTGIKNRSENLMIVDLLRNDLGRVCRIGSVNVPHLMEVESYATVHQLVSTIRGRLNPEVTAVDCVRSAFPGGSMTGAPKIRTMEIIDRLETSARGIYSGSLGFLGVNGSTDLNIVIRTAVFGENEISIGVGGAIVALSDPDDEFEEILLKSSAILKAFSAMTGRLCTMEETEMSGSETAYRSV